MTLFPLTIKEVQDEKELRLLQEFMLKQAQFYPNYDEWVYGKCTERIESGQYKPIIAIHEKIVVGDTIHQFLEEALIEIKNFRIDPEYRNVYLGSFLLKQIEARAPKIITDVTVDNFSAVEFFLRSRFKIEKKEELYLPGQDEFVLYKDNAA